MSHEHSPLLSSSKTGLPPFDESDSNLTKFRKAIGINIEAHGYDLEAARKSAKGLYKEIISIQQWRSRQYRFVEILWYLALAAQIVIGATLTALGPKSNVHSKAITILGVVNTSIAGILAVLKGQGLPDRLRKDEFEMRKVQDYIEESETRLVYAEEDFTDAELDALLQTVFAKYNAARDTAEMNRPDRYAHQGEADVERRPNSGGKGTIRSMTAPKNGKGKDAENIQYEIS
jgi:hypothetical protein